MSILAQRIRGESSRWFYSIFHPWVVQTYRRCQFQDDGYLLSWRPAPVQVHENTRLYSCIVRGLGRGTWCHWAMARREWLCLDILVEMENLLLRHQELPDLQEMLAHLDCCQGPDINLHFEMCWAPHKMKFQNGRMESTAPGSNERADFSLVVWDAATPDTAQCIATIYHTTNVPSHTSVPPSVVVVPETRLLGRCIPPLGKIMDYAVARLAFQYLPQNLRMLNVNCPCPSPALRQNAQHQIAQHEEAGEVAHSEAGSDTSDASTEPEEVDWVA